MPRTSPLGTLDGRAFTTNLAFEDGKGPLAYKGGSSSLLALLDRGCKVLRQTIDMADATHTIVQTTATTAQTRLNAIWLAVDPNSLGASENLVFPAEASLSSLFLFIENTGGEIINVQNDTPATILSIPAGDVALITCDGTTLRGDLLSGVSGYFTSIDLDGTFDQDKLLAAAGTLTDMALTNSIANGLSYGLYVHAEQVTNKRTGGALVGFRLDMTGLAADDSAANCVYQAANFNATKAGGTSTMTGITFDAGWDSILDISACATGEADVIMGANLASAMDWRVGTADYLTLATSTGLWSANFASKLSATYGAASGNLIDGAYTCSHASNAFIVANLYNVHDTNRAAASVVDVMKLALDSAAGDDAASLYNCIDFSTDGTQGVHTAMRVVSTGFDALLDLAACATGEADVVLGTNLASAMAWRDGATDILAIFTTTGAQGLNLDGLLDQDYARTTAGALVDARLTVSHASDAMDVFYAGNVHNTARTGVSVVNGYRAVLDSDAADDATVYYNAFRAETDGSDGIHSVLSARANFDYTIDSSDQATGENRWSIPTNKAIAWQLVDATTALIYSEAVTTTGSERMIERQQLTVLDGVAAGTERRVGGRISERSADSAALVGVNGAGAGADPETVIDTVTIPANTIKEKTRIHFKATCRITVGATAGTLQMAARLGGVGGQLIAQNTAADPGGAGQLWIVEGDIIGRAAPGAGAACVHNGECASLFFTSGAAPAAVFESSAIANQATNGALTLVITGLWNSATNDAVVVQDFMVEVVG